MTPFAPNRKGQQLSELGEHPICGNWIVTFGTGVSCAKYGWLQLPVNNAWPLKFAVVVSPVNAAGSGTTIAVTVAKTTVEVAKVLGCDVVPRKTLLASCEGAQPTKFGALWLTLLHSCWLN